jgi:hypothetical protein
LELLSLTPVFDGPVVGDTMVGAGAPGTFLERTNQLWKLRYLRRAMVVAGSVLIANRVGLLQWGSEWRLGLVGILIALFVWVTWAIRCPFCGSCLYWRAVSEHGSHVYTRWLEDLETCPSCGSDGVSPPTSVGLSMVEPRRKSVIVAVGVGAVVGIILQIGSALVALFGYEAATGSERAHGRSPQAPVLLMIGAAVGGIAAGAVAKRLGAEWRIPDLVGLTSLLLVFSVALSVDYP